MLDFNLEMRTGNDGVYPTEGGYETELENLHNELIEIKKHKNKEIFAKNRKELFLNIPCSFDIETTSWYEGEDKKATMYVYVFGVNGKVFVGRTWQQAMEMFTLVSDILCLGEGVYAIFYVHNLAYEFQFIRKLMEWSSVFATDQRTPIKATTTQGIIFKDSLALSGYSLAKVAEHLLKYKVSKMVGDLEYRLKRNCKTPLTSKEWGYVFNDGLVVMAYIREEMERNKNNIEKIPLTKTGYVRRYMRNQCLYAKDCHQNDTKHKYLKYKSIINQLTLDTDNDEYGMLRQAFQGGFTHANAMDVATTIEDVTSMDFTSSYPSVLVSEMFPMSKGKLTQIKSTKQFNFLVHNKCCLFYVEFKNIHSNDFGDNPISYSKCLEIEDYELDNGRVYKASRLTMVITDIDYEIYEKFYTWKSCSIGKMFVYEPNYLPTDFVKGVLNLYQKKTTLKGVEGMEAEYMHSKEDLNSCYGMCVTALCKDENVYEDGEWKIEPLEDRTKEIEKYNNDKRRFLSYAWGVWCTAYARRNLFTAIYAFRNTGDYLYSDTDSVKIRNYEKHKEYFEAYNANHRKKLELAMKYHGLPMEMVEPKTIKGVSKLIGVWDYDGHYKLFRTLGAKRYLCLDNEDKLHITISGVNKRCGVDFLEWKYKTPKEIFNHFSEGLEFVAEYEVDDIIKEGCGKKVLTYLDDEDGGTMVDYLGNKDNWHEGSFIHMEATSYTMSMAEDFINFIKNIQGAKYTNVN